jgi:perosamine synthetase
MNKPMQKCESELALYGGTPVRAKPIETIVIASPQARDQVMELLASGMLSNYYNGRWARRLEEEFARYHGTSFHAVAVNSGTSALHLALTAAGVGPGDEVIVPALCFIAAAAAVVQNGGIPIICDAEPESLTLDLEKAERLITSRTKAILPVHFWGYPSNAADLCEICRAHHLALIEDCAQAFGAPVRGNKVGTYGEYATFSFCIRKHIASGEGGIVLCRNEENYRRLRALSNYGKGPGWDDYETLGYSYRLAEFSSIVALDGLSRLNEEIEARRRAVAHFTEVIVGTGLKIVPEPAWGKSVYFKCPIVLPLHATGLRQQIVDAINAENISCRVPHRPLYAIPWLAEYLEGKNAYRGAQDCPVVAAHHPRLIEIESGPHLPLDEARISGRGLVKVWNYFCD